MTKKVLAILTVLAAVAGTGLAVGGGARDVEFSAHGAMVANFGAGQGGRVVCGADCGTGPCVVDGKLSLVVTPSGKTGLNCNAGTWLLGSAPGGMSGSVDCGEFGSGKIRVTPSSVANYFCKN